MAKKWWQDAVIYQIYPRSFQDSNGDGIGDLQGIIRRLDYLQQLGIDAIWLGPVFKSPQSDNGYDIADYQDIDPMFGTIGDMEELIQKAGEKGIRIILDMVLNHTSDEHPWFMEAKKSKDNPYHDYYVWRDGTEGAPPNELRSIFSGSAWEWAPELEQYYLHQFAVKQPDLNWENETVRQEIYRLIRWWMDKGAGGFRFDVIDQIAKEPDRMITTNGPRLHEFIREMSREALQHGDLVTVGETWGADLERAKLYSAPDGSEFSMIFQFEHIGLDQQEGKDKWDLAPLPFLKLKEVLSRWQEGLHGCGWNSLFWDNHDLPRIVSRWGNDREYRVESAKMLATILHGMEGTPYIYEGEELGMTNVKMPIEDYRDIETLNMYQERLKQGFTKEEIMASIYAKGRDNARTPMQWDDSPNAGFTDGTPWLKVNPNYREINAADQVGREDSIFEYYRKLIALRKLHPVIREGRYELLLADDPAVFAYRRIGKEADLLVIANFYGDPVSCPAAAETDGMELLISNYSQNGEPGLLRPYEARMYLKKKETA